MPPISIPIAACHDWHENLVPHDHELLSAINHATPTLPAIKIKHLLLASARCVCRNLQQLEVDDCVYNRWSHDWHAASYVIYRQHLRRCDIDALASAEAQIAHAYPSYWRLKW